VFAGFCSGRTRFSTTGKGKTQYAHAKVHELLSASPRIRPVASWQISAAAASGSILPTSTSWKRNKIKSSSSRTHWRIQLPTSSRNGHPSSLGYRNKATYPLGISATRSRASWFVPKAATSWQSMPRADAVKPDCTSEAGYPAAELASV